MLSIDNLLYISRLLIGLSLVISSAEIYSISNDLKSGGLFDLEINRRFRYGRVKSALKFLVALSTNEQLFKFSNIVRGLCGILLLINWDYSILNLIILMFAISSILIFNISFVSGKDGSDQMTFCVLLGLIVATIGLLTSDLKWQVLGFGIIAFQSSLSYLTAGIAKAVGSLWKSGDAIALILGTRAYGSEYFGEVSKSSYFLKLTTYFVIAIELLFPLSLILPLYISLTILGLCILMHLFIALTMGLNRFLWTFIATYPSIIWCNLKIRDYLFHTN